MATRSDLDQFYTLPRVAERCVEAFKEVIPYQFDDNIVEPSAGSGSFCRPIAREWIFPVFIDIDPHYDDDTIYIEREDFFAFEPPERISPTQRLHFLGNPPFGRQSCLARRFIKRASEFQSPGDAIAFILPISFRKPSFARIFPPTYHKVRDDDVEESAFTLGGIAHDVRCVFQVWVMMDVPRIMPAINSQPANGWSFAKKDVAVLEDNRRCSFAVRRVGGKAGTTTRNLSECNVQCFYFIILRIADQIDVIMQRMDEHQYIDQTVGPRSIAKNEVMEALDRIILDLRGRQ